jgi:hypothetical protein
MFKLFVYRSLGFRSNGTLYSSHGCVAIPCNSPPSTSFIAEHLNSLEDPRLGRNKDRLLIDILTISICAVICGAENQPRA